MIRDINTENGFCGAYCFHDQITESAYDFFGGVYNSASDFRDWAQKVFSPIEVKFNPKKLANCIAVQGGAGLALYGALTGGIALTAIGVATDVSGWYANDFEWDWNYWLNEPWIEIKVYNETMFKQTYIDLNFLIYI